MVQIQEARSARHQDPQITLPEKLVSVADGSFTQCSKLALVICKSTTIISTEVNPFRQTPENLQIRAPASGYSVYKTAWKDCANRIVAE